jgi:hypothetical protein
LKPTALLIALLAWIPSTVAQAQEADAGVDLRATLSGQFAASSVFTQPSVAEAPASAGFRGVFYPTVKFSDRWAITAAWQLYTRPYFFESFSETDRGASGNILQASLNYSRVSTKGSLLVRVGELSTAFGSFLLRYDDADNPLANVPLPYGYYSLSYGSSYYAAVSSLAVAGAQIDATRGKFDGRAQFANSSPANPRSIFDHDQYGNWAGGGGYTIRQGLRIGVSGYRGPYLDRQSPFFRPGEANPSRLPAHALGVDSEWGHGHWNIQGEFQRFVLPYTTMPTIREDAGYIEARRTLGPRWYAAARTGYSSANQSGNTERFEFATGFRPNRFQLLKADYELDHRSSGTPTNDNTFFLQYVTTFHLSHASPH